MTLAGRVAVVTGASRGIGLSITRALADNGAHVWLVARSTAAIGEQAARINDAGRLASAFACDVTNEESVATLVTAVGTADILVNNAGAGHSALLQRTTLEDWNRIMSLNATAPFLCTRALLPGMLERKWGRVINIASVAGLAGQKYIAAYTASKHAVIGLTRAAAMEVDGTGVTVNAVCPAFVDTTMTEETIANVMQKTARSREDALAMVLATQQQERLVSPDEVAHAVVRICLTRPAMNGEAIILDGRETDA